MTRALFFFALLILYTGLSLATVIVDPQIQSISLGSQARVYATTPDLPVEHILRDTSIPWQPTDTDLPSYGFTEQTYWFDLTLTSRSQDAQERLLEVGYPLLDRVRVYVITNNRIQHILESGDAHPFEERLVHHRLLLFPLTLAPQQTTRLLIRVDSTSAIQMPMTLWEPSTFWAQDQYAVMAHSIYYGLVFVMMLYNLFLFMRLKDSVYLYYVLYVLSFCLAQMSITGFAYQLLWPLAESWNQYCIAVITPLNVVFGCIFVVKALKQDVLYPRFAKSLYALSAAGVVSSLLSFFLEYHLMIRSGVILAIVACCVALCVVYYTWLIGRHHNAKFFAIAWTVFLTGVLGLTMNKFGLVPRTFLTEYAAQIGSALEILLLSYALAERLNEANKQRFRAESKARRATEALMAVQQEKLRTQTELALRLESEVKARTRELQEAMQVAKQANRQKTRFLTAATHDIRQPLQALSLMVESIGLNLDDQVATEGALTRIRRAIDHLVDLFERLFDLSKIDNQLIQPQISLCDPRTLLTELVETLQPLCQSAGVRLDLVLPDQTGWIRTDPLMLKRCLIILADNALKHAQGTQLTLSLDCNASRRRFNVIDNGIGIPATEQTQIFEEFYQIRNPERNRKAGLGLGLSLCKRLCELMQASLVVSSTPGRGSHFHIELESCPHDNEEEDVSKSPRVALESDASHLKILVIDDDEDACFALTELLRAWHIDCEGCESAEAAFRLLDKGWEPDVALIDYRLPGELNGLAVARRIRERLGEAVSILLITGDMDLNSPEVPFPVLYKPLKPSQLRAAIQRRNTSDQSSPR
ncbi:MAG: response regulator [Hahellaceae bacterium]|nr:response regulator [Hahellaceae bacterium]